MSTDAPPVTVDAATGRESPTGRCLQANLAALFRIQPVWASRVEQASPEGVCAVTARDGSPTYRIRDAAGPWRWLGGTSTPRKTAEALFGHLSSTNVSVILPGIFTGYEPLIVAEQLEPCCAVFVCEDDAARLRLAMTLYDYSALLEGGRLVFLGRRRAEEDLREFFSFHRGYEFPRRLLRTPQIDAAAFSALQQAVESACEEATLMQARLAEEARARIATRMREEVQTIEGVLLLTASRSRDAQGTVRALGRACALMGLPFECRLSRDPRRMHILSLLEDVERLGANVILLVDGVPAALSAQLPESVKLVTWFSPGVDPETATAWAAGSRQPLFTSTTAQFRAIRDRHGPTVNVSLLEPGLDEALFRTAQNPAESRPSDRIEARVPPSPDDRAETFGMTLPTHRDLWELVRNLSSERVASGRTSCGAEILEEVMKRGKIALEDAELKHRVVHLIEQYAVPAARWRMITEALRQSGVNVRVFERRCQDEDAPLPGETRRQGSTPRTRDARESAGKAPRVVHVWPSATPANARQLAEDVVSGTPVFAWRYARDLSLVHPQLSPLLERVFWFNRPEEVVRGVQNTHRREPGDVIAERATAHGMSARLTVLFQAVQVFPPTK